MPVLRVDDEVWKWLQGRARPFEDTPNSVLRRVAALDPESPAAQLPPVVAKQAASQRAATGANAELGSVTPKSNGARPLTGKSLNLRYKLGARHALYHKDGMWFERLARFPGVYCDTRGYVRFENELQFVNDPRLAVGDKVNIRQTLASHPHYRLFTDSK